MQKFGVFLLHGVTGSGKTEVYLRVIEQVLNIGKSSIVLVPEISLTPQTIERFMMRFQQYGIVVLHSRLSDAERYNAWQDILHGRVRIVIGVRSAIFAPVKDLGLIVVDEEHETSYKQYDTTPRYNARDVAVVRAKYVNATVILGSATPSVETYYNAQIGKYNYISLPYRIDGRCMPEIEIIDMRKHNSYKNIFSDRLQELIHQRLLDNQQIILFLNRRGFAPFIQCRECGLIMRCPDCEITLTYHIVDTKLKCHCCGYHCEAPDTCPKCNGTNIKYIGMGTQKIVEEIHNLFPTAKVARMDVDAVAKHTHEKILNEFKMGKIDILIGTQMIAKGLDYPNVTLVGVISADVGLNIPDFRSAERTFGLLTQVAGRAGRGRLHGVVIIQTYSPEHYSVQTVVTHEYKKFYDKELKFRKQLYYPPFTHLVSIIIRGKNKETTQNTAEFITHELKMNNTDKNTEILGPAICVVSKKKGYYRYRILIKTIKTGYVKRLITYVLDKSSVHAGIDVIIDMDPVDML
jgi:primosomal protein N' (replication factor Y)